MNDDVVFIGDSLTAWGDWNNLIPGKKILNLGVPGNTTSDILVRLKNLKEIKAKKIFIMVGINDLGENRSLDDIAFNYKEIIFFLKNKIKNGDFYLQSIFSVSGKWSLKSGLKKNNIQELNRIIRGIAEEESAEYCDFHDLLMDEKGCLSEEYTIDGLHLNEKAYSLWSNALNELL